MPQLERNRDSHKPARSTADVRPTWGHPLLNPDGEEIRLPRFAFAKLRALGLLYKDPERNMRRISDRVYYYLDDLDLNFLVGLRKLLGPNVSEPEWVQCRCRECHHKDERADKTAAPSRRMLAWHEEEKGKG